MGDQSLKKYFDSNKTSYLAIFEFPESEYFRFFLYSELKIQYCGSKFKNFVRISDLKMADPTYDE